MILKYRKIDIKSGMFDFHNHFTDVDSCLLTGILLPQNYNGQKIKDFIAKSEIGMDKRFENSIEKDFQILHFERCLKAAYELQLPVQIHCVGYTECVIQLIRKYKFPTKTVLWHRFNGSIETAAALYKLGVIVSIANDYKKDILDLYKSNKYIVLETDYEGNDPIEHARLIEENYRRTAVALGISLESLEEMTLDTGKAFTNTGCTWNRGN